jgi:hypothetical protein
VAGDSAAATGMGTSKSKSMFENKSSSPLSSKSGVSVKLEAMVWEEGLRHPAAFDVGVSERLQKIILVPIKKAYT